MATDSKTDNESKKPDKKIILIAALLVVLMISVIGILVVVLLKLSNQSAPQTIAVQAKQHADGATNEKDSEKSQETIVKADGKEEPKDPKHGDKKKDDKPSFYKFNPAFIVNIPSNGRLRFLQIEVQLMTKTEEEAKNVEAYSPIIRNDLITLFSSQNYDDLLTSDGKENLRKSALTIAQKILKDNTGSPCVVQVLFTNFVTQ
jgi:flagellar FliL protein